MNRRLIACLLLVVLALQSVAGAHAAAVSPMSDMSHCAHAQLGAHNDAGASTCCDHCTQDSACMTQCSLCFPAMYSFQFSTYSINDESIEFVAKQLNDRDYPPLNPPPIA